jgi:hypothetical protein
MPSLGAVKALAAGASMVTDWGLDPGQTLGIWWAGLLQREGPMKHREKTGAIADQRVDDMVNV